MAFFNIIALLLLWKTMQEHFRWEESWLAIFCWLLVPLNIYVYNSNLLEGTLVVFTELAAWLVFYGLCHGRSIYFLPAAVLMTLAFLTNGLEAFSVLSMPFIFYAIFKQVSFNKMVRQTFLLSIVTLLFIVLIMLYIPAQHNIKTYLNVVIAFLSGSRREPCTGWQHFAGINLVLGHLYPSIGATCIVLCIKAYCENHG
jgi:4-amino-4-deoxy-L-arabinose transferase-like glycosyltransferase